MPEIKEERNSALNKPHDGGARIEGNFGSFFSTASPCPTRWMPTGIKASFKRGALIVTIPKAASAKPQRIEVSRSPGCRPRICAQSPRRPGLFIIGPFVIHGVSKA
ncbi:MAG: hypothetical protein ABR561_08415 [Guyparkeria sp.]